MNRRAFFLTLLSPFLKPFQPKPLLPEIGRPQILMHPFVYRDLMKNVPVLNDVFSYNGTKYHKPDIYKAILNNKPSEIIR